MPEFLKFVVGWFAVLFLGIGATLAPWLPGSAPAAQDRLHRRAEAALAAANAPWAAVVMEGQKAVVSGVAPSADAREAALGALTASAGPGGVFRGGITRIDADALTVAPSRVTPSQPVPPPGDAGARVIAAAPAGRDVSGATAPDATVSGADVSGSGVSGPDVSGPDVSRPDPSGLGGAGIAAPRLGEQEMENAVARAAPAAAQDDCDARLAGALAEQSISFAVGQDAPGASSRAGLAILAEALAACPDHRLRIAGHTDSTGDPLGNLRLSERRAAGVAGVLTGLGVEAGRLDIIGRGAAEPLFDNATPEGRGANRRIDLTAFRAGDTAETKRTP